MLNVLLKATLYEWHHQHGDLPSLPANTREALRQAAEQTENPAFHEYVLDEIAWLATDTNLEPILDARDWVLESGKPAETIGRLYADLMSNDDRQILGQFRTPPDVGSLMRTWAAGGDDCVLDPGMGAGVLLIPFDPQWDVSTDPAHVDGIDRSRLSHLMGTTALTLYGQAHDSRATDFLDLSPADLQQDVNAIICNPPYTSGDSLPAAYKDRINTQIEQSIGSGISARSPLYAYFIYHARQFLSAGDRAAFITPQSFLTARYGESLKEFLLERFSIKAFVQFDPAGERIFSDAHTTALITFLEATPENESSGETRFIRVDESVEGSEIRQAVERDDPESIDWGLLNSVPQTQLNPARNWEALFTPTDIDTSDFPRLDEFATVHRGKTTGEADFFCLSQADVDDFELDTQHLSRLIRQPKLVDGYDFRDEDWEALRESGEDVWLCDPDAIQEIPESIDTFSDQVAGDSPVLPDDDSSTVAHLLAYLRDGVNNYDLSGTGILKKRTYWYRPERQDSPRIIVPDASREGFTFQLNETEARNIHNFNGLYDVTLNETELKALLAYLNSGVAEQVVRNKTRTRQSGLKILGSGAVKQLPVIDVTDIDDEMTTDLADLFDELRETARVGGDCERVISRVDAVLQQIL
ncbi:Eco57I restriction-modification methylase domain-containing protein [Halomicrobium katesii]|uniref:Eco57I restriction-modification methylase domain-containing protein n=1 Tax=Halomicrobium katesii TaxID=437163 RepID=UPI00036919C8|nr:N-6 DNA methylase [Halomicrobium katesii]